MKIYLTDVGQALLYKAQGGKVLKFTRFGLGDGELNGQAIQKLTTLLNEKMSSVISKLNVKNNKVTVGLTFDNSDLTEGFYFRELGLFAEDPDTQEEILYMYGNSGETSDYIDANTSRAIEENLDVEIIISDVENITATIEGSLVYLTLNGDASNVTATFIEATTRENISAGEKLSVILGKIKKWFSDLKTLAFSGSYNDADNKPQINGIELSGNKTSADLSVADASHTHDASQVTAGTLRGQVVANADAVSSLDTFQVRNIKATNEDLEAGVTPLATGNIVVVFEAEE